MRLLLHYVHSDEWQSEIVCLFSFFFFRGSRSADVLPFGTDLQLRNRTESKVAEKKEEREREEEWHGITCPWPPQRRRKLRFSSWQEKERNGEMNSKGDDGPEKGGTLPPATVISVCQRDSSVCGQRRRSGGRSSCCWADASELRS